MNNIQVSVIMSVYNAEDYLSEAIDSILNQTFQDFEFIIIDDGSTDRSKFIIGKYALTDSRIKLISRENKGLIYSLNEGISLAKGKYIARMDADDISDLSRLEKQVFFLEENKEIGIVSCNFNYFKENKLTAWPFFYQEHEDIMALMPFHSPVVHAAVLMRRDLFCDVGYEPDYAYAEDYRLWTILSKKTKFHNLNEVLYKVRQHDFKVSVKYNKIQVANSLRIIKAFLERNNVKEWNKEIHQEIITTFYKPNTLNVYEFIKYMNALNKAFHLNSNSRMIRWIKSVFIVHNTKIPFLFIFYLLIFELRTVFQFSFVQFLSLTKRSFHL